MLLIWQCSAAQSKYLRCVSGITWQQLFIWSSYWNNAKIIFQSSCNMLFYMKGKQSPSCLRSQPGPGSVCCEEMYRYTALGQCPHTHNYSLQRHLPLHQRSLFKCGIKRRIYGEFVVSSPPKPIGVFQRNEYKEIVSSNIKKVIILIYSMC